MAIPKQCKAKTKSGRRCEAYAVAGSDFCLTHAPERARDRAERNRKGGYAKRAPKPSANVAPPKIESIADVLAIINLVIADLWVLENTVPRARGLLASCEAAAKALEIGELEARVAVLEDALKLREVRQ